jgi:hypothetical protein
MSFAIIKNSSTNFSIVKVSAGLLGNVKVWDGSSWVVKPAKIWNGSSWQIKPVKHWTGSLWASTNY